MQIFLLIVLLFVTLAMIGAILLQRSEGGGLGIGGGNMGGLMTNRGTANFLTRTTGILATLFMVLCIVLAIMAARESKSQSLLTSLIADEKAETQIESAEKEKDQKQPEAPEVPMSA